MMTIWDYINSSQNDSIMEDVSSKVKTKKFNQSDLYLHIKTVTSDSFDKKIVILLKEPWVLIHLSENTTFWAMITKADRRSFKKIIYKLGYP